MSNLTLTIDGRAVQVEPGTTILQAANAAEIYIPALCAHPDLPPAPGRSGIGAVYRGAQRIESSLAEPAQGHVDGCQLCAVKVQGTAGTVLACSTLASGGMGVQTTAPELEAVRKRGLARILATHPHVCLTCAQHKGCAIISCSSGREIWERCCSKNNTCEIQKVSWYVGIPEYRLPSNVLDIEIDEIVQAGVEIRTNAPVESLNALAEYDAIYVALGAHRGVRLGAEGENSSGVLEAVTFLREVRQNGTANLGPRVAVIGGGNAAIDAARTARRLGAKQVSLVYRRSREETPAASEEVAEAVREGVEISFLTLPQKVTPGSAGLDVELVRMQLGEPDVSGRRSPEPIPGSAFTEQFDNVIVAIGQTSDVPSGLELSLDRRNRIIADAQTAATNTARVFAGGDAVLGPSSVFESIAAGRKAASAIDRFVGGNGDIEEKLLPDGKPATARIGRDEEFARRARQVVPCVAVEERLDSFVEVKLGYDEATARGEASRCLRCGLRLTLRFPMMPPDKWLELNARNVSTVPAEEGAYQLLDQAKNIIFIAGTMNLRRDLEEVVETGDPGSGKAKYFVFEREPMYTKKESELIQLFLGEHRRLPEFNGMDDDLFA